MIFKFASLELTQGTFRLTFSPPLGAQKQSHTSATWLRLYQLFHSSPWGFHGACRFLFSHLSGKQPSFLLWKDCHELHNQARYQAFSCFASQSQFLRASWWQPEPRHASFRRDIPVKASVNKLLMTGLNGFMQRNLMSSFRMPNSGGIR